MNLGNTELELRFEVAIELLSEHLPVGQNERKPVLMHSIRVGMYLYERDYPDEVVLGGLLHDILEQSDLDHEILETAFGEEVYEIVLANSQDDKISETVEKWQDMVLRCAKLGKNALIVKAADVIDSYQYYSMSVNQNPHHGDTFDSRDSEVERSRGIGEFLLENLPEGIEDPIFDELKILIE